MQWPRETLKIKTTQKTKAIRTDTKGVIREQTMQWPKEKGKYKHYIEN